jgi:hypothetical protein
MTQYNPNAALYWWEHLTKQQRRFLTNFILDNPIPDKIIRSHELPEYWYSRSQTEDLHKLDGWPETSLNDMRNI